MAWVTVDRPSPECPISHLDVADDAGGRRLLRWSGEKARDVERSLTLE